MKPVYLFLHLRYPSGCWFRVCGDRCSTFRLASRLSHLVDRSL